MPNANVTRLHDARQARLAAHWRTVMTSDPKLTALRDGFMRFAHGCTREEADKVLAQIIAIFGMSPNQLVPVVDVLAGATGFGPHATVLFLYQLAMAAQTTAGRTLLLEVAKNLGRAAAEAGELSH